MTHAHIKGIEYEKKKKTKWKNGKLKNIWKCKGEKSGNSLERKRNSEKKRENH